MNLRSIGVLVAGCAAWALGATAAEVPLAKYQFHVRAGKLMRGTSPFVVHGIEAPALLSPQSSMGDMLQTVNRIAEVGGNTVCFDLDGFSSDGTLSEESAKKVSDAMVQITWRRMGVVCRVLGPDAPTSAEGRLAAVRSAALAVPITKDLIYWIDGPDEKRLIAAFRAKAPGLCIMGSKSGDIVAVSADAKQSTSKGRPVVVLGKMSNPPDGNDHYLLPGSEETYAALDKAMADPLESQPWTPDNSVLSEPERADGWTALFDGKTLNGWVVAGKNKEGFRVRDGIIEWAMAGGVMLRTKDRYDNFSLRLDWKIADKKNSGLLLRAPRACRASKIGFEFQLQGDSGLPADKNSTGSVYDVVAPKMNAAKPAGEWNSVEITLNGPHLKALLNGQLVQDVNFDEIEELKYRLRRGFIGLQDHGGQVAFRNIRIKRL